MRVAFVAIVLLSGTAAAKGEPGRVMISGIGRVSCATWLSSPDSETQGNAWILGFWTGQNYSSAGKGQAGVVGSSTDALGIIGAVKKRCLADPASTLVSEAGQTYLEFKKAGR